MGRLRAFAKLTSAHLTLTDAAMSESVEARYLEKPKPKYMGGQAVLEGVMMRGYEKWAIAVRTPDQNIALITEDAPRWAQKYSKIPLVRGVVTMAEALKLGFRALSWSAEKSLPEEEQLGKGGTAASMFFAVFLMIGLFIALPTFSTRFAADRLDLSTFNFHLLAAVVRMGIFIGYLVLIGRVPDIRRVFEYHGAEHKAIAAYENNVPVVAEEAQKFSTRHVRCGTNFMLTVMVVTIAVHVFFGRPAYWKLFILNIATVPIVAGISYEIIRFAANHMRWGWVRLMMHPGLFLQKVTTREPDIDQLDVAIASLRAAMTEDQIAEVDSRAA